MFLRKFISSLLAIGIFLSYAPLVEARSIHGAGASFTPAWQPLPIGAGGQVTAIYNYSDGTTLARSDNFGAWLYASAGTCDYGGKSYAAPCWKNLLTASSIPNFSIDLTFKEGAIELVAAPSNTNVLYMLWNAGLYVSTDKGAHWTQCTNFVGTSQTANNGNASGPFIAVDPNNPDIVFVDSGNSGVYRSTNGTSGASATFTQVSGVGTTTAHVIAFQPGSSTHILIWTKSTGAFESTNGTSFSAITAGSPPSASIADPHIYADKFNQFWVWDSGGSTANVYFWASSTWTARNTGSTGNGLAASFAVDPNSASVGANKLASTDYRGAALISTDNGATWTGNFTNHSVSCGAAQPTWLCVANQNQGSGEYQLNGYSIIFDQSSNLLFAGGLGIWQANATITTGNAIVWNANTVGIEQLVSTNIISPAGYALIMGAWDKGFFLVKTPGVYPSVNWDNDTTLNPIIGGWAVDYASSDPTFITGWAVSNISASNAPAKSTNGGNDWTLWGTTPSHPGAGTGGAIAALDSTHWILQPSQGNAMLFTSNGGSTWNTSTIAGTPTNWTGNGTGIPFAADRVTAGVFCAVDGNENVYSSTDSGASFTKRINTGTMDGSPNSFTFKSTPSVADTFFYTAGEQSAAHPANTHLWKITKTTNSCDTAAAVNSTNLKEVMAFGFGAHKPGAGGTCPTLYVNGWLNGTQGIFYNTDCAATTTWTAINVPASQTPWPLNSSDFPKDMAGDLDVYGRIYLIFSQSAGTYIDTADACPWVGFTNVKPNAALTGTVTLTAQHSGLVPVTGVDFFLDGSTQIGSTQTGQSTYSVSFNASAQTVGAHTLTVRAQGNGCTTSGNSKTIPITTS